MKIEIEDGNIISGVEKLTDVDHIDEGVRLFYELGRWGKHRGGYGKYWMYTGKFKEIEDPVEYSKDSMFKVSAWVSHHNFVILKSEQ